MLRARSSDVDSQSDNLFPISSYAMPAVFQDDRKVDLNSAKESYAEGDYALAVKQLTRLLHDGRTDQEVVSMGLGLAHYELAEYTTAQQYFEQVLARSTKPRLPHEARINLGNCLLRQDDFDAAEQHYRLALNTPCDSSGRYNLGNLRCLQGQYDEALDWLEQALKARPDLRSQAFHDEEFEPLRSYARFTAMVAEDAFSPAVEWLIVAIATLLRFMFSVTATVFRSILAPARNGWLVYGWLYRRLLHWCNPAREIHGIRIGKTLSCCADVDETVYEQVGEALSMIRRCDPRRHERICTDLDWILIDDWSPTGVFDDGSRACVLDLSLFATTDDLNACRLSPIHRLAKTIVHEACHARLFGMGVRSYRRFTHRHESLCCKQEQRFLDRAKSDKLFPVAKTFDTQYACRYTLFHKWCYERNACADYRPFLQHVWSDVNHYVEHVKELREALDRDSQCAMAWFVNGYRSGLTRQFADAIDELTTATRLQDDLIGAWRWLGNIAFCDGDYDLAFSSFWSAVAIEPDDSSSLQWLVGVAAAGNNEAGKHATLELCETLVATQPHDRESFLSLACAQVANDHFDDAVKTISKVLKYDPTCTRARQLAMSIYERIGRDDIARDHLLRYRSDRRVERDKFSKQKKTDAIVLACEERNHDFQLRCLFASRQVHTNHLRETARRLCADTTETPTNLTEDYLYSIVRRRSSAADLVIRLPRAVNGHSECMVVDTRVPSQCFADCPPPTELGTLPIWFDRTNTTGIIADIALDAPGRT